MPRSEPNFLKPATLLVGITVFASAAALTYAELRLEQARKRPASTQKKTPTSAAASLQRHRNLGKAFYEQGKYAEAIAEFQKVIATPYALATDHLDLGIALMEANRLDEALGELATAKKMDPKLVAADYNLGILYKHELRYPDAESELKRVIEVDPGDPAAWFNLGTVCFAEKKLEQALDAHQHVVAMGFGRAQNFYVASLFHTFTTLTRLRRQEEAQQVLKIHQQMRDRVPGISLQNPALEGGKYGAILVPTFAAALPAIKSTPATVVFSEINSKLGIRLTMKNPLTPESEARRKINSSDYSLDFARRKLATVFHPSVALGDYDSDGRPDLYVLIPRERNHLLHQNSDGKFVDVTEKAGVAGPGASLAAVFADYNNSGHASLFVAGLGGITLYQNNGDGTFSDQTEKAGLLGKPGELATRALLFDADNDGFLDLIVTTYADLSTAPKKDSFVFPDDFAGVQIHFYRNNGDGTFAENTATAGLDSAVGRWRGAVFADFNNDGYADLLLVRDDGPPALYINQGEAKFANRTAEAGKALAESRALDAQVADFDHDGSFDIVLWSQSGYQVLLNRGGVKFEAIERLPAITPPRGLFDFRGAILDADGDGFDDLLAADSSEHWRLIANQGGRFQQATLSFSVGGYHGRKQDLEVTTRLLGVQPSLTPAWLGDPGKLDLLEFTPAGQLVAFEKQSPPARWSEVKLDGFKSNKQGIGAVVEFKAGNFYSKVLAKGEPVRIFTGDLSKLDVVRVTWPNLIVQNALDVATNKAIVIRESERLASSCPLLYLWNGERYVFFTDILGVAPLGELGPDGSRIKPNPEEFVRLGSGLRNQDGMYVFQITDELREVDYVDQLRLFAVNHPATEEIYANEIYSSSPVSPTLYAVRSKRFPMSAVDDHGHDVLPLIRGADGRYPTDFRRNRILGLADLHTLTLDLGELPHSSHVALWLTGWVFWTDSNTSRALASNRALQLIPPYLQVRDGDGRWVTVISDMGLPSGTNRTLRVDLTGKFLSQDHHVRIVTNLCVYWDQIFFTMDDVPIANGGDSVAAVSPPPLSAVGDRRYRALVELPLVLADLHYRGFSTPVSDAKHLKPDSFDYAHVLAEAPWNPMTGNYTRYGPVDNLLREADDRLVVMSTGDELTARFSGRKLPPLEPGWKRDFFLYARGYAKDGEPNTAFARSVGPLPFSRMSNYPYPPPERFPDTPDHRRYLAEYQTRPGRLLIAPLAPAVH